MLVLADRARLRAPLVAAALLLALVAALAAPLPPAAASGDLERLQPSYLCPQEGQTVDRWAVFNPNDVDVPFTWELHKSSQSGAEIASPGVYTFLTTTPIPGPRVLMVFVDGQLLRAIPATPACLALDAPDTGTLSVSAVLAADEDPESDVPLDEPFVVRVDGEPVGTSNEEGVVEVTLEPGTYEVEAVVPSFARGTVTAVVEAGETTFVTVRLLSGTAVETPSELLVDEVVGGALSLATQSVTLRFVRDGENVVVTDLAEVDLYSAAIEATPTDLTAAFAPTPEGTIAATDLGTVLLFLSFLNSEATLRVRASDAEGFTYHERVSFIPGRYQAAIELEAPPSRPDLPLGGVQVSVRSSDRVDEYTSDQNGVVFLETVPAGPLHLEATTTFDGHVYNGLADISIAFDTTVRLAMVGVDDVLARVRPWFVSLGPLAAGAASGIDPALAAEREAAASAGHPEAPEPLMTATSEEVSIFTIAGSQNVPMTDSASLEAPQGAETVTLTYQAATAEYPFWVMQQSIYDDTWRLTLHAPDGQTLFTAGHNVNSQLYGSPVWNGAGNTGQIQLELDVSAFTTDGPAQFAVSAHATNIGDSILPTSVTARLSTETTLTIDDITQDEVAPLPNCRPTVRQDHFSIPRPGATNTLARTFDVTYTAPSGVTITNVVAELLNAGGGVLDRVVNDAPGSSSVTQTGARELRVRVTHHDISSPIGSTPPPTDRIRYRFVLTGSDGSGATIESDPKESAPYFPLWRMPDGLDRFGGRDLGGDDWSALTTYQWLDNNRHLVTRINDISGEHSRNICHATHADGKDIDMFHVYTFPGGAGSGGENYNRLSEAARGALAGDATHLGRLNDWAVQTRQHFDALLNDPQVRRLYYAEGRPAGGGATELTRGWAQSLLEQGTYTNPAGQTITLPAGAWGSAGHAMTVFDLTHSSHFHVSLR